MNVVSEWLWKDEMKEILMHRTECIGSAVNELNIVKSLSNGETQSYEEIAKMLVCIGFY